MPSRQTLVVSLMGLQAQRQKAQQMISVRVSVRMLFAAQK
jgi:hypothetical protein